MQVNTLEQQKGFTLVEIAIVLVIIGLLLGGVLKGQELITNSKIKSVTQDFDGIQAAYYAYQDRLGSVPGDGDGDGKIDSGATGEQLFWDQLRTQGFVKGASASTHPTHALDGTFSVDFSSTFNKNEVCATNIDGAVAQGMDTKMDDGVYNKGIFRTTSAYAAGTPITVCREL
ncbi:prepilin-type N-terminal cleavage/methylation domain-containing protein [Thiomicrorhabdus sp. Milos-T2]|uniref:prepilin-type N-terminal cleavage/methylation domain-containing protein n=1 Tax=Thiomicrorhabdus sp. Milos-T2 TaxID=90814 RepID=UPI00068E8A26|nr:prepilin-type N-terminal cleavage/methylation domain-containing protein [Thiomicrorhabdus sp. Milos-T2]